MIGLQRISNQGPLAPTTLTDIHVISWEHLKSSS
uniref:Uncharacterized protein n=1 Tax=Arundo donax TaxID=35708 RepID=A0A0A9AYC5_ARUDO